MVLEKIDNIVDKFVKHYSEDWYKYDRPNVGSKFVVFLRECGVDTLFLNGKKAGYSNCDWTQAVIESERSKKILFVDGEEITLVNHLKASMILCKLRDSFPLEYLAYCNGLDTWDICPTLEEWNEYQNFNGNEEMQNWLKERRSN